MRGSLYFGDSLISGVNFLLEGAGGGGVWGGSVEPKVPPTWNRNCDTRPLCTKVKIKTHTVFCHQLDVPRLPTALNVYSISLPTYLYKPADEEQQRREVGRWGWGQ